MTILPDPSIIVIFGGTGDLARRKLLPALVHLAKGGHIRPETRPLPVATADHDDSRQRKLAYDALVAAKVSVEDIALLCGEKMHYQSIGKAMPSDFTALAARLTALEQTHALPGNRAFYLALPPQVFVS